VAVRVGAIYRPMPVQTIEEATAVFERRADR